MRCGISNSGFVKAKSLLHDGVLSVWFSKSQSARNFADPILGIKEACARVWNMGSKTGGRLPLAGGFEEGEVEWSKWSKVYQGLQEMEESFKAETK